MVRELCPADSDVCHIFLDHILPAFGVALATAINLSPMKGVHLAVKRGKLFPLNPMPFAIMVPQCLAWTAYSWYIRDWYVFAGTIPAVTFSLYYLLSVYGLATLIQQRRLLQIMLTLIVIVYLTAAATYISIDDYGLGKIVIGSLGDALVFIFYASPLYTLKEVLVRKSSASIDIRLAVACELNALIWTVYGVAKDDMFVYLPNAFGVILGLIQIFFLCVFPHEQTDNKKGHSCPEEDVSIQEDCEKGLSNSPTTTTATLATVTP